MTTTASTTPYRPWKFLFNRTCAWFQRSLGLSNNRWGVLVLICLICVSFIPMLAWGEPAAWATNTPAEKTNPHSTNASPAPVIPELRGADIPKKSRELTGVDTLKLITDVLQQEYVKDKGSLELDFTEPWIPPTVPDEPLTIKILELPLTGVAPAFIVRFELWTSTEMVGTYQTSLRAHVWRDVWVARSNLARGELLSQADVELDRRDVLGLHEGLAQMATNNSSLELAETIEAGNILMAHDLKPRAVLHRGQMADALLQDGALNIMLKVEVLEDGAPGQIIQVRNPASLRNLSAKVMDEQTVAINL